MLILTCIRKTGKVISFIMLSVCRCQTVTCSRITMMKSTLSFWGTSEAKTGGFRLMFMAMVAPILAGRKDMVSGLILQMISISTVLSGLILRSCECLSGYILHYVLLILCSANFYHHSYFLQLPLTL